MRRRCGAVPLAGVASSACLLLALVFGSAAGAAQPPDLTGTWTPTTGGAWMLSASGPGLNHLHADWAGTGAHAQLRGTFDGTLNGTGTAYTGQFSVTEGSTQVNGAMTFTIVSPNKLTVTLPGSTIVMTRSGGASTGVASDTASVLRGHGEITVKHADGSEEPLTTGATLRKGDEISTGVDSQLALKFKDGTVMTVDEMTQLQVVDLLDRGTRQAVNVAVKLGEVSAQVNPKKSYQSDFRLGMPMGTTSSRGTAFSVFYDPGTRAGIVRVTVHSVVFTRAGSGRPLIVPAGKEVEVTAKGVSPLSPLGKADTRGGIDRQRAFELVAALLGRSASACAITPRNIVTFAVRPAGAGWLVSVTLAGNLVGSSIWTAAGSAAAPANQLAQRIAAGCKTSTPPPVPAVNASVTFTQNGSPAGRPIAAPAAANDIEANMDPHTGVVASAFWTEGGHSLGPISVPAGATGLFFTTSPSASAGSPVVRPNAATDFHVLWNQTGVITSAYWTSVGKLLATIPIAGGQKAIAFTNSS